MPRTVPEWIGATPDAAIPARVKLRIFERAGGRCHISGRKIAAGEAWDCDHIIALRDGGEHRESNLAPALRIEHRRKTANEATDRAKVDRTRKKYLGLHKPKGRPMPGTRASGVRKKFSGEVEKR